MTDTMDFFKAQYEELCQKLKASLPINAYPVRELVHVFRDKNKHITLTTLLTITDVFNSGDISGIMCTIKNDKNEALACALTHLLFSPDFHLYDEIIMYQKKRAKRIRKLNNL
jgi:hypothetical protein